MGFIIGIVLVYLAFVVISWLVVNILVPVGKWVGIVSLAAGILVGAVISLKSYITAIIDNINPYDYYTDRSKNKQEFARRRSYFFGPGLLQLKEIVFDAWSGIADSIDGVSDVRESITDFAESLILRIPLFIVGWLFYLIALITVGLLGGAMTLALTLALSLILLTFMTIIFLLFSITWLVDRIYLHRKSIKTSCPFDQERVVIPVFECPRCEQRHTKLIPGPYGIWYRRCVCGKLLPTTFLLGRSSLKAFCKKCGSPLATSDAQQFSISVIGGTSSGKTLLLAAFFHEFMYTLDCNMEVDYKIPEGSEQLFKELKDWYGGAECIPTTRNITSTMYSLVLKSDSFDTNIQFSVYDISGEALNDPSLSQMLPQKQMRDSNGAIIVIDPLSSDAMRSDAAKQGDDTVAYSNVDSAVIVSNFVTYFKTVLTNLGLKKKSDKPVAVAITKVDLASIAKHLSYDRIQTLANQGSGDYENFSAARDDICREFLIDIGLMDAVNSVEAAFSDVHYFPVSAIGHPANGKEFEPEHVVEPFYWFLKQDQPVVADLLGIEDTE